VKRRPLTYCALTRFPLLTLDATVPTAAPVAEQSIEALRLAVLMFLESVIILDAAIAEVAVEHLNGQPLLFRDSALKLAEQLQMASGLSTWFNELASEVGAAEIDLEEVRNSLRSETNRQISIWVPSCPYSSTQYIRH
jgi:hypothetical protein